MIENTAKEKQIKSACKNCREKPCEGLYWVGFLVLSDFFAVPFDCPLRVEDESKFRWELHSLCDYDVSRISGDVWTKHNFGPRCVYTNNHKSEEIEYLLRHFRQNKCIMIAKSADPWYKPWTLFGFWANSGGGGFDSQLKVSNREEEEEYLTDSMADEVPAQLPPLKITGISWQHTDVNLRNDSPGIAHAGNTIDLQAKFENYVEGAGVDFMVYGKVSGTKKQIAKVHTRCKNMAASAEWVVDISRCDVDNPSIEFECEARDKKSKKCLIDIATKVLGGACIHLKDENAATIEGAAVTVFTNEEPIFSDVLSDGILELTGLLETELRIDCEYKGLNTKQIITWVAGKPPYVAEDITLELNAEPQE